MNKEELRGRLSFYDEMQLDPVSMPSLHIGRLPKKDAVEAIIDWFHKNFEDPANCTPYESREGGYQYIWGGPYDTNDIIETVFDEWVSKEVIDAAISELTDYGLVWVPNSSRQQPPEDYYDDERREPQGDISELHAMMLERLSAVESRLDEFDAQRPIGIGHNRPPDGIVDHEDIAELRGACAVLKEQPVEPDSLEAAQTAFEKLRGIMTKWAGKAGQAVEAFTAEAAKASGQEFGKWVGKGLGVVSAAYLAKFVVDLDKLIVAAGEWLSSLSLLF